MPTVRFYLDATRTRYWERLIGVSGRKDDKKGPPKAIFGGKRKEDGTLFQGDVWAPLGFTLEKLERCFIVEGIFHAIALHHAGYKAVAAFSCNHFPHAFIASHAGKSVKWVVAFGSDVAGEGWAKRHHARLKELNELATVCAA